MRERLFISYRFRSITPLSFAKLYEFLAVKALKLLLFLDSEFQLLINKINLLPFKTLIPYNHHFWNALSRFYIKIHDINLNTVLHCTITRITAFWFISNTNPWKHLRVFNYNGKFPELKKNANVIKNSGRFSIKGISVGERYENCEFFLIQLIYLKSSSYSLWRF